MITENLSTLKINKLTQAQYDRESVASKLNENEIYLTPDRSITIWQPDTLYKEGEYVLGIITTTLENDDEFTDYHSIVGMYCINNHTSGSTIEDDLDSHWTWFDIESKYSIHSTSTTRDSLSRVIHETYATKEEVGNIETALDAIIAEQEAIIAIQNALIGGGNV